MASLFMLWSRQYIKKFSTQIIFTMKFKLLGLTRVSFGMLELLIAQGIKKHHLRTYHRGERYSILS